MMCVIRDISVSHDLVEDFPKEWLWVLVLSKGYFTIDCKTRLHTILN